MMNSIERAEKWFALRWSNESDQDDGSTSLAKLLDQHAEEARAEQRQLWGKVAMRKFLHLSTVPVNGRLLKEMRDAVENATGVSDG